MVTFNEILQIFCKTIKYWEKMSVIFEHMSFMYKTNFF